MLVVALLAPVIATAAESPCVELDVDEELAANEVVVVGKVVERTAVDAKGQPVPAREAVLGAYKIEVKNEFKGDSESEYTVFSGWPLPPPPPGSVWALEPFVLHVGTWYLLFARRDSNGLLVANSCATQRLSFADDALKELGEHLKPKR